MDGICRKLARMAKSAGIEAARLVSVSTILFAIHKAQQGKYQIRDLKMNKKTAKEPQVGYAVLEKIDLFLVSVLVSPLASNWCQPWCQKEKGQRLNTSDLSF